MGMDSQGHGKLSELSDAEIYQRWVDSGAFVARGEGKPYSIAIPPPNVTGVLHMGHGFQMTIMDALARFHRMQGRAVHWQVGTDHAGISTQMVVERLLEAEGTSREELGREAFEERAWQWARSATENIREQMSELGISVDWSRTKFTLDEDMNVAVRKAFVQFYREGLIKRGERMVNWDPVMHTALSDLEVVASEEEGKLWHFAYPLVDPVGGLTELTVATTRPETMLGDMAVAVHPEDERYREVIGSMVHLPLVDRYIPVVADDGVDSEFGTGCVKITPAHDFFDFELGQRLKLGLSGPNRVSQDAFKPLRILDWSGCVIAGDHAEELGIPADVQGADRLAARTWVLEQLEAVGASRGEQKHTVRIPRGERGGAVLEPMITNQWFMTVDGLAAQAVEKVEQGEMRFVPPEWVNEFRAWMDNIHDWCISRQLWWGHRIPAWYDEAGNVYVGETEEDLRAENDLAPDVKLNRETDVLDTWFSSGLWTFATLGWPEKTEYLERFHPTSALVTGFDIIFFWVARMMMMSLGLQKEIPFKDIYIHGLIRDSNGQKMSKTKGNVIDPMDIVHGIDLDALIAKRTTAMTQPSMRDAVIKATKREYPDGFEKQGIDVLRFAYLHAATTSRDINWSGSRLKTARTFKTKLQNAARFVFAQCDKPVSSNVDISKDYASQRIFELADRTSQELTKHFADYRFDLVANTIYEFVWNDFCDWYLEIAKLHLRSDDAVLANTTRHTLVGVFSTILRMLHPLMPFETERLFNQLQSLRGAERAYVGDEPSLVHASFIAPFTSKCWNGYSVIGAGNWDLLIELVSFVRGMRSVCDIAPSRVLQCRMAKHEWLWQRCRDDFASMARVEFIEEAEAGQPSVVKDLISGKISCHLYLPSDISVPKIVGSLQDKLHQKQRWLAGAEKQLANKKFREGAPPVVFLRLNSQVESAKEDAKLLEEQLAALGGFVE